MCMSNITKPHFQAQQPNSACRGCPGWKHCIPRRLWWPVGWQWLDGIGVESKKCGPTNGHSAKDLKKGLRRQATSKTGCSKFQSGHDESGKRCGHHVWLPKSDEMGCKSRLEMLVCQCLSPKFEDFCKNWYVCRKTAGGPSVDD